jgi:translocation and assembly module TamB
LRGLATSTTAAKDSPAPLIVALNEARFEGWTWGNLSLQTPAGKLLDPASWSGNVDLSLAAVRLFGWSAKEGFLRGKIADGRAELSRLAIDLDGSRLRGSGRLNLTEPYDFASSFSLASFQLSEFNKLPEAIRPPVNLAGTVNLSMAAEGTLDPLELTGMGSITGDSLEAGRARVDHLAIEFGAQKDRLTLNRFEADLYGGRIAGDAEIPLEGDNVGHVDFQWQAINLGQFITDVARLPVTLRGTLAGKLHIGMPAGKLADILAWDVGASFDTSPLVTQAQRLGELHGRLTYGGRQVDYRLNGELLRGPVELAGRWQPTSSPKANAVNEGHFQWADAHLDALTPLLAANSTLDSLTGLISVNVRYRHDERTGVPTGTGDLKIDAVRLNGEPLFDELHGVIRLAADRLEMMNADAAIAGGSLTASGYAFLDPRRRGMFRITIGNADVAQLLAPWPRPGAQIRGVIDAQVEGFFGGGRPVVVTGTVAMSRGRAGGIELDSVRVPLHGTIDPTSGRGTFELHGITGQIAHGRVTGDFDLALANGIGLNGRGKFAGIDLRTLLQESGNTSRLASGKITGKYTLGGRNIRSSNDLTGTLDATLRDTQAMSLPIFQRALPYLTGGVSGSTTFDDGTVRGSLARGVMRVDRFSLSSGSAQIFAQGNVTLAGRLDLNVTVNTGQLNVPRRTLSLLASRILLVAAPPIGLLVNITQFLSNQVINLEVTGTVRSPTIRIRPLNLLGQEAAQFFLLQALP